MRERVDGNRFQADFEKYFKRRFYLKRLPTLGQGYSGLTQPADFILVGKRAHFVELKETGKDSFSITGMQQYDEMLEFNSFKTILGFDMDYLLVVHFIKQKVFVVVDSDEALGLSAGRKSLNYKRGKAFASLEQLERGIDL